MKIEHAAIWTKNLEALKDFYVEYFDGTAGSIYINEKKRFQSYFIRFDSGARLELMQMPAINDSNRNEIFVGFAHIAFSVGSKEAVDSLTERLRKAEFPVISEPRTTGDGYYESCVSDPDGNHIEITI